MYIKSLLFIVIACFVSACAQSGKNEDTKQKGNDTIVAGAGNSTVSQVDDNSRLLQSDTVEIKGKPYILGVYKDTDCYFFLLKKTGEKFDTILIDNDYTTNNSSLTFRDENKDGYQDIVWTKKWQDHAYLFNPAIENFVEVGEFHNIDTLKQADGAPILYNNQYPLLYLINREKDFEWMTEMHSELFVIKDDYTKVSFATLDNMATLDDLQKNQSAGKVIVNCYVPSYTGRYGPESIWNTGRSIDSLVMKADEFNNAFILTYWQEHYKMLLSYGRPFAVRRAIPLKYFK